MLGVSHSAGNPGRPLRLQFSWLTQVWNLPHICSMLLYVHRDHKDYYGRGTQDGHLDFHTVPAGAGSAKHILKKKKRKRKKEYQSTSEVITAALLGCSLAGGAWNCCPSRVLGRTQWHLLAFCAGTIQLYRNGMYHFSLLYTLRAPLSGTFLQTKEGCRKPVLGVCLLYCP